MWDFGSRLYSPVPGPQIVWDGWRLCPIQSINNVPKHQRDGQVETEVCRFFTCETKVLASTGWWSRDGARESAPQISGSLGEVLVANRGFWKRRAPKETEIICNLGRKGKGAFSGYCTAKAILGRFSFHSQSELLDFANVKAAKNYSTWISWKEGCQKLCPGFPQKNLLGYAVKPSNHRQTEVNHHCRHLCQLQGQRQHQYCHMCLRLVTHIPSWSYDHSNIRVSFKNSTWK